MDQPNLELVVKKIIEEKIQTIDYYFSKDAVYTEWREELHDEIVDEILSGSYSKDHMVFMLGGAPANGKSTFLNSGKSNYPGDALKIDPDEIKKKLPEYPMLVAKGEKLAANAVHEESSVISKRLRVEAMEEGVNIIMDGVADGTFEARKQVYEEFKEHGYYVRMDYVTLATNESLKIAMIREKETGRHVPPEFIKDMNKVIALLVPKIIENQLYDEFYLWDTNIKGNARLILSQKDRKLDVEIHDEQLYQNFIIKSHEG